MCQDCAVLHERLKEASEELFKVKRANSRLKGEVRFERQEKMKIIKDHKEKSHREESLPQWPKERKNAQWLRTNT